jgi:uncharacterized protein (TIGR00255 family)
MTGYGRAQGASAVYSVAAELRSVNHRYFDCSVRLPRLYSFLEDPVRRALKDRISRGKFDVYISVERLEGGAVISCDKLIADRYYKALRELKELYSLTGEIDIMSFARLPEVFTVTKAEEDEDELLKLTLEVLSQAVEAYMEMSLHEGDNMKKDILAKADSIEKSLIKIEGLSAGTVEEYRARLYAKMREILADTAIDDSRILTEAAIYADRTAINEETVRLHSHIQQLRRLMDKGGEVGRSLDFLIQEFNREINTIGSKTGDLAVTRLVVDVKAEIEKMREQAQNIE